MVESSIPLRNLPEPTTLSMDEPGTSNYRIPIANCQSQVSVDEELIRRAAQLVLAGEDIYQAEISIAVVDDSEIHQLNQQYLEHDYPTDVLSFLLSEEEELLEGEIILSADTAAREAAEYGWPTSHEMCLYVIHGVLHLVGYDDGTRAERDAMQAREDRYLSELGMTRPTPAEHDRS